MRREPTASSPARLGNLSLRWALACTLACAAVAEGSAGARADANATTTAVPTALPVTATGVDASRVTPMPTRWLPTRGRECGRRARMRRYCQGPRRAPEPHGPEADLARRLELGELRTVSHLLRDPAPAAWIAAAPAEDDTRLTWPVDDGRLWRGFGRPPKGARFTRRHKGIDIGAPAGSLIRATRTGLVVYADNGIRGYGNLLITVHADGSMAFYAHCRALYLFPGQAVLRGQVIGEVGQTGIARGTHLHFEYREHGRPRDPLPRFADRPGAPVTPGASGPAAVRAAAPNTPGAPPTARRAPDAPTRPVSAPRIPL
jgi:murein DD-endopeptidase MepM/ murein hydrolase activator NlpD